MCVRVPVKWLEYWPGNRKVPGSMPSGAQLLLLFPWARNFTHIAPVHPAVLMGTWC